MLTFRPISYADADLRSFKYVGSACREGVFCKVGSSSSLNIVVATPWSGNRSTLPTLHMGGAHPTVSITYARGIFFPIFRENPDPESVACTINQNDMCIGMALHPGSEFEVHFSATEKAFSTMPGFTKGRMVCIGSTGKLTPLTGYHSTSLVVGVCTGTYNGKYVRVHVI